MRCRGLTLKVVGSNEIQNGVHESQQYMELVDPPEGIKPIGCKWVFKRKKGADGKVETYKAHLIVKGYCQHYGIDYDVIFFSVAILKFIRIMLAIAAYLDFKI